MTHLGYTLSVNENAWPTETLDRLCVEIESEFPGLEIETWEEPQAAFRVSGPLWDWCDEVTAWIEDNYPPRKTERNL